MQLDVRVCNPHRARHKGGLWDLGDAGSIMFKALVVEKNDEGKTSASVKDLDLSDLPEAEVTVAVDYSTVNYKDGLCIGPGAGLVRNYPHVPGIDFALVCVSRETL